MFFGLLPFRVLLLMAQPWPCPAFTLSTFCLWWTTNAASGFILTCLNCFLENLPAHGVSIFMANGHWALLFGQQHGVYWTYFDGLHHQLHASAMRLATGLSAFLRLSHWTLQYGHCLLQSSPRTCGTLALVTVGVLFGLFLLPPPELVLALHHALCQWNPVGFSIRLGTTGLNFHTWRANWPPY